MTDEEKLALLATLTDSQDTALLTAYLANAKEIVINRRFPYGDGTEEMPSRYDRTQVEIAAALFNRRGTEGEIVHVENGMHLHYEDGDVPTKLLRRIIPLAECPL